MVFIINLYYISAVFMKINGIANEPVKLDWVPPNVSPDMVSLSYNIYYL